MSEGPKAEENAAAAGDEPQPVEDVDLGGGDEEAAGAGVEQARDDGGDAVPGGGKDSLFDVAEASHFPLALALVASVVLLVATGSHYGWAFAKEGTPYSRYAISVSSVAMILSFGGLALMRASEDFYNKMGKLMNATLFAWSFVGACFLTFRGPFTETSNGYFAAWAMVCGSALAIGADARALESKVKAVGSVMALLASSVVVVVASVNPVKDGCPTVKYDTITEGKCDYKGEAAYALALACVTVVFVLGVAAAEKRGRELPGTLRFAATAVLAVAWIVSACLVTFRGPFAVTGNGYFASWAGAATSTFAAFANLQARREW